MTESEKLSQEMAQLKKDLGTLQSDVSSVVKALKAAGVEETQKAYGQAKNQGEALFARGEAVAGAVGHKIDENPMTSVLTAFGVGFILGSLLTNRRS